MFGQFRCTQPAERVTLPARACPNALGSVTELGDAQVDDSGGEVGEVHPAPACFVAPQREAGIVLQAAESVLDQVSLGIEPGILRGRIDHAPLGRDVDGAAICGKSGAERR